MWDAGVPGLGLRATAGSVSYIFQGRIAGGTVRTTIGDTRTWDIDGARQKARELQKLIDDGKDPRVEKAAAIASAEAARLETERRQSTLGEVWPDYIKAHRQRWSDRHTKDHEKVARRGGEPRQHGSKLTVPGVLASLLDTPLPALTAEMIAQWLKREAQTRSTQAALAFRLLRACLNWCAEQPQLVGLAPEEACKARTVRQVVPKKRAKADCLQREQLGPWFTATRRLENTVVAAYLQTLLLTGARREELAGIRWEDVDFRWKGITIHDKVEGERTIPLTPYVSALLNALPRVNEWVFSSPRARSGRIQEPGKAHIVVMQQADIETLTLHGLRRSFGTLSEWIECPAGVVAQIMGHKPSATAEKHYRHRPLDLLRMWHEKIEQWMLTEAGILFAQSAEVA